MKFAGIIHLEQNGRIVFPTGLRQSLNILPGDSLELFIDSGCIHIRRYTPTCILCGEINDITPYKGRNICFECLAEIQNIWPMQEHKIAL
jgi:AbrB family transcriptional regulator, transcriptional pleiotropic regulator of transition state genes